MDCYIDFLNKDKNFREDRVEFFGPTAEENAILWAKEHLEKYDRDMIKFV